MVVVSGSYAHVGLASRAELALVIGEPSVLEFTVVGPTTARSYGTGGHAGAAPRAVNRANACGSHRPLRVIARAARFLRPDLEDP